MISSKLAEISRDVRFRLEERRRTRTFESLRANALNSRVPHDFLAALKAPAIIAEIKARSPSEGVLKSHINPVEIAGSYLSNGASALSVLTEQDHFHGSPSYLVNIRREFPQARLLMKDFIIDAEQIYEARVLGADSILLIVSLLNEAQLREFLSLSSSLGLTTLVEIHDESEMTVAEKIGSRLIGINNRNLKTLEVSLNVSRELVKKAPPTALLVAESGLTTSSQIAELFELGFSAFLIGSSLMKASHPGQALAKLRKELAHVT